MALSSSPGISAVQLVRTVGHTTTNHLIPALCTSSPQTLPMNNSCLTNAVHLNNVSVVSPVNVHINTRTSAPSPTALKLATVAASMDRVPKVTPSSAISSIARCVCVCVFPVPFHPSLLALLGGKKTFFTAWAIDVFWLPCFFNRSWDLLSGELSDLDYFVRGH